MMKLQLHSSEHGKTHPPKLVMTKGIREGDGVQCEKRPEPKPTKGQHDVVQAFGGGWPALMHRVAIQSAQHGQNQEIASLCHMRG